MKKKFSTKKTEEGFHIEYTYVRNNVDGKPVYREEAVFEDGHREMFRMCGGYIFGYLNTRLGLSLHEPPSDFQEVLSSLPDDAYIETA